MPSRSGPVSASFNLDVNNLIREKDPVVRIRNSVFAGKTDASSGVSQSENKFKIRVTQRQPASSTSNCYDSKGTLEVVNNTIGIIGSNGGVDVEGGTVIFDMNYISLLAQDSFLMDHVKDFQMTQNNVRTNGSIVLFLYMKSSIRSVAIFLLFPSPLPPS